MKHLNFFRINGGGSVVKPTVGEQVNMVYLYQFFIKVEGCKKKYREVHTGFRICRYFMMDLDYENEKHRTYIINEDNLFSAINKAVNKFESEFSGYIATKSTALYRVP